MGLLTFKRLCLSLQQPTLVKKGMNWSGTISGCVRGVGTGQEICQHAHVRARLKILAQMHNYSDEKLYCNVVCISFVMVF